MKDGETGPSGSRLGDAFELTHPSGIAVNVMTYGGIVQSLAVPDRDGRHANVVLSLPTLEDYMTSSPYFGAIIGRYANRIAGGRFTLDGKVYTLAVNDGAGSLHGGDEGFDRKIWEVLEAEETALTLGYTSPDGEEGYPGQVDVEVTYRVGEGRALRIDYTATSTARTPISLTNHSYFNLGGEGSGSALGHRAMIDADRFMPIDSDLVATGELRTVRNTELDFLEPRVVEERIREGSPEMVRTRGYDYTYVLNRERLDDSGLAFACRLEDPRTGRSLEVWTTERFLDFYTGNYLDGSIVGSGGRVYRQGDGIAVEPERVPNGPNSSMADEIVLNPGEVFRSTTEYRFSCI